MEILEFLTQSKVKELVLSSKDFEDFKSRVDSTDRMGTFYIERNEERAYRSYWTVKNYPKSYHHRALSYPHLTKLSDFFEEIWYEKKDNPQQSLSGIYIHQSKKTVDGVYGYHSEFGDVLQFNLECELQGESFVTACCRLKEGIECNVFEGVGAFEFFGRTEGLLLQAKSRTHIGSDWLAIITDFDLPIKSATGVNNLIDELNS
jgi:hypothetical protein